ncbi:MAG: outer membrane beta-barrel protein [Flammeovirgaceae bacterium]
MRTAHIWNQHNLFGQKIAIIVFLLFAFVSHATAQRYVNLPNYEDKDIRWGFQIGLQQTTMRLKYDNSFLNSEFQSITSSWQPAFSAHFILQVALEDELWSLRLTPGVALYNRIIEKTGFDETVVKVEQGPSTIEFPILLKYRSLRRRNFRMYMVGGVVPSIITGAGENSFVANRNFEITYGLGFDFYWQFFKFAPEIRFSHGLINFYNANNTLATEINRITTHRVGLYLNFE